MKNIIARLKAFCECTDVTEKDVVELINVVSFATCWAVNPCETFLSGERTEYVDLECSDCPVDFVPYYHPFKPETFRFQLVTISDTSESYTDLDFGYIPSKGVFKVKVPNCGCKDPCGCVEYKLKVTYTAGYESIPECLLPVMCNLLDVLHTKNKCNCGCGCNDNEGTQPVYHYAQGDIVTVTLETDLGKMLVADYKRELGMISLCRRDGLWGFVV